MCENIFLKDFGETDSLFVAKKPVSPGYGKTDQGI